MAASFDRLLDATIEHVQRLRAQGVRFLPLDREALTTLREPVEPARRDVAPAPSALAPAPTAIAFSAAPLPAAASAPAAAIGTAGPMRATTTQSVDGTGKLEGLQALRERAAVCMKCAHLAGSRQNVVFGVGDPDAALMFVGEAPGADEDRQGEPFVGAAGQLLTRIIQTMGLSRQRVYIANILKCRPDTPGQKSGNRKPTLDEMRTCIPYLHSQIDLIQPRVLVALGGTAIEGLLGKTDGITRLRGCWQEYRGIPLMPTFHPSYLLRNQALTEKRKVWEDMLQVMERLGLAISDKHRSFFLKG